MIEHNAMLSQRLGPAPTLLLGGGLVLVVAGLVSGELFALLLSHRLNADLRSAWQEVLAQAGRADAAAVLAQFEEIQRLATERARAMSLHSHFGPYGLLAAGLGLARVRLGRAYRFEVPAALAILVGGLMQSLSFLSFDAMADSWWSVSNGGAAVLLVGMVLYLPCLRSASASPPPLPRQGEPGGGLLRIGAALVLFGLLFGLYLAGRHVFFEEPALHAALHDLVGAIVAGDADTAQSRYAVYKSTQIRMAITAAAHSHAVAFGFIMLVVALATAHLQLHARWRSAAFVLIAAGGLLLPVFVYLAPRYGYIFALCADSAGGLVILGLLIVLVGLVPHRGVRQ